jgi:hypothetical protein
MTRPTAFAATLVGPLLLALVSAQVSCTPEPLPPREPVSYALPTAERGDFLDTPFPSDLLIKADGRLDLRAFPNPFGSQTLEDFLAIFETAPAWAGTSTMYFRVEGGVDESTLPQTAKDSVGDDSGLFLMELDGPTPGRRLPIEWRHYPEGTAFLPPGTVAVNLLLGAVPSGRFALVVTSTVLHENGTPLGPSADLSALYACDLPTNLDRDVDCGPYKTALAIVGKDPIDVAAVIVVTPQRSADGLVAAYDVARAYDPVVSAVTERVGGQNDLYTIYDGTIRVAHFQAGNAPYDIYDGRSGGFVFEGGVPVIQGDEDVPFTLTVPKGEPMPTAGWPVVINGHGTGGDLDSGLGTRPGAEAFHITQAASAMFSISEPLHFTRVGYREGQEDTLTFNFFNPLAGRDNWRQSALEKVMQVTALSTMSFTGVGDAEVHFDAENISYFGHSQGGIVGGLFIAVEDRLTGALLSGAGAGFAPSLIEKTEPIAIVDVLKLVLQIPDDEPVDTFHPVPALLQTFVDAADPLNYGALWRAQSGKGTHLVATSGLEDTFTPKRNHAGLAGAFGLPLASPIAEDLEVLQILGIENVGGTVSGNQRTPDDEPLTAAMVQYPTDGHFAIFQNPAAHALFSEFFTTLRQGTPTIRTNP